MVFGAWFCLFAPLAGALAITLAGTAISRSAAGWISTLSVFAGFAGAVVSFVAALGRDGADRSEPRRRGHGSLPATSASASRSSSTRSRSTMMLIVTGVGGLIVWYSMGYMHGEDEERRYFAYMALFVFSMLLLVQGGNLLLLLAGWGLVGLASYLLIGFDHHRPEAIAAAKKAFLVNAVGDALMALALLPPDRPYRHARLLPGVCRGTGRPLSTTTVNLVALGLLGGADREVGPDPAPHVASGRDGRPDAGLGADPRRHDGHRGGLPDRAHAPVFEAASHVQHLAAVIGAVTLLVAGFVALVQNDIKRVIAYSTMSQIGYMFLGAGIGAYSAAMFHLVTHAFFKALLFLPPGSSSTSSAASRTSAAWAGCAGACPSRTRSS